MCVSGRVLERGAINVVQRRVRPSMFKHRNLGEIGSGRVQEYLCFGTVAVLTMHTPICKRNGGVPRCCKHRRRLTRSASPDRDHRQCLHTLERVCGFRDRVPLPGLLKAFTPQIFPSECALKKPSGNCTSQTAHFSIPQITRETQMSIRHNNQSTRCCNCSCEEFPVSHQGEYIPTPEEIRQACLEIQSTWSAEEFVIRRRAIPGGGRTTETPHELTCEDCGGSFDATSTRRMRCDECRHERQKLIVRESVRRHRERKAVAK